MDHGQEKKIFFALSWRTWRAKTPPYAFLDITTFCSLNHFIFLIAYTNMHIYFIDVARVTTAWGKI